MQNAENTLKSSVQMTIIGHFFKLSTKNVLVDSDFRFLCNALLYLCQLRLFFLLFLR
jgi:hypothetical protein